jgi:hypothetical protein
VRAGTGLAEADCGRKVSYFHRGATAVVRTFGSGMLVPETGRARMVGGAGPGVGWLPGCSSRCKEVAEGSTWEG